MVDCGSVLGVFFFCFFLLSLNVGVFFGIRGLEIWFLFIF